VEVAKSEQDGFDFGLLLVNFLFGEEGEGTFHVGFESLWWLVSQLNASLEKTNWNGLRWIRGKVKTETWVGTFDGEGIKLLFQLSQEARHEMDVLKHNPVTFFVTDIEPLMRNNILTLTQGNRMQHLCWIDSILPCQILDILYWIGSW
jgi:hypothetical protein